MPSANPTSWERKRRNVGRHLPFRLVERCAVVYVSGLFVSYSQVRLVRDAPDRDAVAMPDNTNP